MKQRTFYLLILVCCMSFFSAANGNGKKCSISNPCCKEQAKKIEEKMQAGRAKEPRFNFSPMDVFVLSI